MLTDERALTQATIRNGWALIRGPRELIQDTEFLQLRRFVRQNSGQSQKTDIVSTFLKAIWNEVPKS